MEESPLHSAILDGLSARLTEMGGGMPSGSYVLVAEILDADGGHATYLATPISQPTHRSMGLVEFAKTMFANEVACQFQVAVFDDEADDD